MKKSVAFAAAGAALFSASQASAATFVVDAFTHSFNNGGGTPLSSVAVVAGQTIVVSSSLTDLWNAGDLPRWSNANGLVAPQLLATGTDESGEPAETVIGDNKDYDNNPYGLLSAGSFSAPYGSLVGRIGGTYYLLGANSSTLASNSGTLDLFYWDTFTGDNSEDISFEISAIPEPTTWALMLMGFGLIGYALRGRQRINVQFA